MELHLANMFALEDVISKSVKRNPTMAPSSLKREWEARQSEFALHGDGEDVIWEAIVRQGLMTIS